MSRRLYEFVHDASSVTSEHSQSSKRLQAHLQPPISLSPPCLIIAPESRRPLPSRWCRPVLLLNTPIQHLTTKDRSVWLLLSSVASAPNSLPCFAWAHILRNRTAVLQRSWQFCEKLKVLRIPTSVCLHCYKVSMDPIFLLYNQWIFSVENPEKILRRIGPWSLKQAAGAGHGTAAGSVSKKG